MNPIEKVVRRVGTAARFLRNGIVDFDTTANVVPSSPFLVQAMVDPIKRWQTRCVLELGSGTGTLTKKILKRLGPEAHVHLIELDAELLEASVKRRRDGRIRAHHGNALDAATLIGPHCAGHVDVVISSLGLAAMERGLRRQIQESIDAVLAPDGTYTQYAYPHARALTVSFSRGELYKFDAGAYLRRRWDYVHEELVPANIPPAVVYTCRR